MSLCGKLIGNRYLIKEKIGEGATSHVYQGLDETNGRPVAVKIMKAKTTSRYIEDLIRFKKEIEIVSGLDHPNIVKIYGGGEFEETPYLVMELLTGMSLKDHLNTGKKFQINETVTIIKQLTGALRYAHNHGIIHRDLKPGNIFLTGESREINLKLLDFGTAWLIELSAIKQNPEVAGTFGYMSPEATGILKRQIDERSDLYSLGIVFYQLLTGELPFQATEVSRLLHQQVASTPPDPGKINREIPMVLAELVLRLLQKDPEDRYQSANGFLGDLERYLNGELQFEVAANDRKLKIEYQTGLIGRETEMNLIKERYQRALKGKGSLCLIAGEAGMGKSRLGEEIRRYVFEENGLFIKGRCLNHESKTPYQPFKDAADEYLRFVESEAPALIAVESKRLNGLLGDLGQIVLQLNPRLEKIISGVNQIVSLEPERENQRFYMVMADFFCNLAKDDMVCVLFIDDLQWSDEGSFNLLEEIVRKIERSHLLIVGAYRDDEIDSGHGLNRLKRDIKENACFTEIKLAPLNEQSVSRLITGILGQSKTEPLDLVDFVLEKSGGNPFLSINIIRELVETKALIWRDGSWEKDASRFSELPVSSTIVNLILKRIEKLTPEQKGLLSTGAVIGREFQLEMLYRLTALDRNQVIKNIDEFIGMQFLERGPERGKALFAHDRIQEVFYRELPEDDRRRIHYQVAAALERMNQAGEERMIFEIAYHYVKSGAQEKSLEYVIPAADLAKASYANEEAIKYYQIALELLNEQNKQGSPEWIRINGELAEVYLTVGKCDEAIVISEAVLPFIEARLEKARIYKKIGIAYFKKGDYLMCEEKLRFALGLLGEKTPISKYIVTFSLIKNLLIHIFHNIFRSLYDNRIKSNKEKDREIIRIYETLGWMYIYTDLKKLICNILRVVNISESKLDKSQELSLSLCMYAAACITIQLFKRGLRYQEKALLIRSELKDEWGKGQSLQMLGYTYSWEGKRLKSIHFFEQARHIFEKIGDIWELGMVYHGLGEEYRFIGDFTSAIYFSSKKLEISHILKDYSGIINVQEAMALSYLESGDCEKAEKLLIDCIELSLEKGIYFSYCIGLICIGYLKLETRCYDQAIEKLEQAKTVDQNNIFMKEYTVQLYPYLAEAYIKKAYQEREQQQLEPKLVKKLRKLSKEALKQTRQFPNHYGVALRVMGLYYRLKKKNNIAERYFLKSIEHNEQINRRYEVAKTYYEYAILLKSLDKPEAALNNIRKAQQIFTEIGAKAWIKRCNEFLKLQNPIIEPHQTLPSKDRFKLERGLDAVSATSCYISSILDIDLLLQKIMDAAIELVGAERGVLLLYPETGERKLEVAMIRNLTADDFKSANFDVSRSIITKIENTKQPLIVSDALTDEELKNRSSVVLQGIRSVIGAPITNKGEMLGVLYLDNSLLKGLFGADDLQVLEIICNQAGVSIENARLYRKVKTYAQELEESRDKIAGWNRELERRINERTAELNEKNLKLEAMNQKLTALNEKLRMMNEQLKEHAATVEELAVARERNRFARDVHDSLDHTLCLIVTMLDVSNLLFKENPAKALERINEAARIAREGLTEVRKSITGLFAPKLETNNLISAIQKLISDFQRSGVKVEFSVDGTVPALKAEYADAVYRVCQEALTNALRHGKATEVNLHLRFVNNGINLLIVDNGSGVKDNDLKLGFGLQGMKQRVESLGGTIAFSSDHESGFRVRVEIPLGDE